MSYELRVLGGLWEFGELRNVGVVVSTESSVESCRIR